MALVGYVAITYSGLSLVDVATFDWLGYVAITYFGLSLDVATFDWLDTRRLSYISCE